MLAHRRIGEILKLKWSEIDFSEKREYIIPSKKKDDATTHILPLCDELSALLKRHRKSFDFKLTKDDRLFPNDTQQRVDSKMKYYSKKAGLGKKISFHSIRTSFVTWAHEQDHLFTASTINEVAEMETLLAAYDLDGLVTDRPDLLAELLGR